MRDDLHDTQQRLLHAERLATIGRMASSISHDLRHPLTAVLANAEFLAGREHLGFGVARAFAWREVEIAGRPKPGIRLSGRLQDWAERVGAGEIDLSMSHSRELATAVAVAEGGSQNA